MHARAHGELYFDWFANSHHHSGVAFFTPADVFFGRVHEDATVRQKALDAAFQAHSERFPNGAPRVRLPPALVAINPLSRRGHMFHDSSCLKRVDTLRRDEWRNACR